ncbi:hypothetical protein EPO05_00900 [Patescibacteria group bacterium]|nr:MAG: hypothetical protein EPO05_00900 [Patescibacteria group bacterium]
MKDINLRKINAHQISGWGKSHWITLYRIIWTILFFSMLAVGSYVWYRNLYRPEWSESEKMNFINTQPKGGSLKREDLSKVIQRIELNRERFDQEAFPVKNIFKP